MPRPKPIYVQIDIQAPIDRLWHLTQTPNLHQRWDLRFSEIKYLPRPDPNEPQHFLYQTRIALGLKIQGQGQTTGTLNDPAGPRSSALKFSSSDPKSLIRQGSGYWKYIPTPENQSVRFLTAYDYTVRFAVPGRLIDRFLFRPLISWATAWSFDRLRLWLEKDIDPATSLRQSLINFASRLTVAFVWLYHGLVPKLILHHPAERALLRSTGLSVSAALLNALIAVGWIEIALSLCLILFWRTRWPLYFTLVLMPLALLGVAIKSPSLLVAPFNPLTFNLCVFTLAAIALLSASDLPSASRCVRRPPKDKP